MVIISKKKKKKEIYFYFLAMDSMVLQVTDTPYIDVVTTTTLLVLYITRDLNMVRSLRKKVSDNIWGTDIVL